MSQVPFIVNTLWDALLDLDDLTASTNSIMTLLSLLLTYPQVQQCRSVCDVYDSATLRLYEASRTVFFFFLINYQKQQTGPSVWVLKVGLLLSRPLACVCSLFSLQQSLTVLVPRVWPFLRHTISSVRRAALQTLFTLLSKADQVNRHDGFSTCLTQFLYIKVQLHLNLNKVDSSVDSV